MFKKIILIWTLMFSTLFSSGDAFVTTLPRKEKAYLDIEVTKIKTEIIDITEVDQLNKRITLRDIALNSSDHLVLTENPDVFGALFSVNGRISALKSLTKETNLSYTTNEGIGDIIFIDYDNLPSKIYAGIWNKSGKSLEKIYELNIHTPAIFKRDIEFTQYEPSIEYSDPIDFNNNVAIELGHFSSSGNGAGNSELSFINKNNISLLLNDGTSVSGDLKFKHPNQNNYEDIIYGNIQSLNSVKVFLIISSENFKKVIAYGYPYKIIFKSNGAEINIKTGNNSNIRDILKDVTINFSTYFEIKYYPVNSVLSVNDSYENGYGYVPVGHIKIFNYGLYNTTFKFSPNDFKLQVSIPHNTDVGYGYVKFKVPGSSNEYYDEFSLGQGDSHYADIYLQIPESAIEIAKERNSNLFMMNGGYISTPPDGYKTHQIGPYTLGVDSSSTRSQLIITDNLSSSSHIDFVELTHEVEKTDLSRGLSDSKTLYLKRAEGDNLLFSNNGLLPNIADQRKITLNGTDGTNGSISSNISVTELVTINESSASFTVSSYLDEESVKAADPGTYKGTYELNIIIDN